jgi:iron(III) transport system ATP-binding protein
MERNSVVSNETARKASSVHFENVGKTFGEKDALNNVNLEIAPGTFLVLLGPSGSGKTTLLRCLAGIERPSRGSIFINGTPVAGEGGFLPPEKRGLAMVFQDYALWPHLTVRANIGFPLNNSQLSKPARTDRVDNLLDRVGIAHLADRYPNQLSGGEQQRVALARALAAEVGLILFDEPLSNLDADRRESLRIEIATLTRESGATALYITHDQSEAFALADKVGVLKQGELVQLDTPEMIYKSPANAFVTRFTGVSGEFAIKQFKKMGDSLVEVYLPFAPDITVEATKIGKLSKDANASLFVRSAGVSIFPETNEEGIPGEIRDVAFNGRGYEHVVKVGAAEMLTKVYSKHRFERGVNIKVTLDPASCFAIDPSTEEM